jgi:hypothetical protein
MDELEYEIVYSPLCRTLTQDDKTIEIKIYRGVSERTWILEVVAEDGSSTVWDERFDSDQDALAELHTTIVLEGMSVFEGDVPVSQSKH